VLDANRRAEITSLRQVLAEKHADQFDTEMLALRSSLLVTLRQDVQGDEYALEDLLLYVPSYQALVHTSGNDNDRLPQPPATQHELKLIHECETFVAEFIDVLSKKYHDIESRMLPQHYRTLIREKANKDSSWYEDVMEALKAERLILVSDVELQLRDCSSTVTAEQLLSESDYYHVLIGSTKNTNIFLSLSDAEKKILTNAEEKIVKLIESALEID